MHSAQIHQKRVDHAQATNGQLFQKPGQPEGLDPRQAGHGNAVGDNLRGTNQRTPEIDLAEPFGTVDLNELANEFQKQTFGLTSELSKDADVLDAFHHYLDEAQESQPFTFYKLDSDGNVVENLEMAAEMAEGPKPRQDGERVGSRGPSAEAFKSLLTVDVEQVLKQWADEKREADLEAMDLLEEEYEQAVQNYDEDDDDEEMVEAAAGPAQPKQRRVPEVDEKKSTGTVNSQASAKIERKPEQQLWVDKYTSSSYFDLLTPETHNRNVLMWLKSWDEIVFPEKAQPLESRKFEGFDAKQNRFFQKNESFVNYDISGKAHHSSAQTEYSFRNKRLLMLHGPPGAGKSTMAKVLAKQCGYEARHINASDLRSGEQLLRAIRNAMTTDSHFDKGDGTSKPCCIIIDEVDGAVGGGMGAASSSDGFSSAKGFAQVTQALNNCIQYSNNGHKKKAEVLDDEDDPVGEGQQSDDDSDQIESGPVKVQKQTTKKAKQKKNDNLFALNRPIIFICNNLYVKPIRPLRDMSLLVKVQEPDRKRVLQRLRQICKFEKIKVDEAVILHILEMTNFDARAAVTQLQFLSNIIFTHGLDRLTAQDLQRRYAGNMPFGLPQQGCKDEVANLFQVAEKVLFTKPSKREMSWEILTETRNLAASMGDHQLLNDCLYENFSGCAYYFDDNMHKTSLFLDQVSYSAVIKQYSIRTQNHGTADQFMYLPAYVFKRFCADVKKPRSYVQYPSVFRELWQAKQLNEDVYQRLINRKTHRGGQDESQFAQPVVNEKYSIDTHCLNKKNMLIDILPSVYQLVHPEVREINIQLFNAWEKTVFLKALEFMVIFNMKLKIQDQGGAEDLSSLTGCTPHLEPDLASLIVFGTSTPSHLQPYSKYQSRMSSNLPQNKPTNSKQLPMRLKTQILLMQNYERIKQAMLIGLDTQKVIFAQRGVVQKIADRARKETTDAEVKHGLGGFMRDLQNKAMTNTKKKRTLDEISTLQGIAGKDGCADGGDGEAQASCREISGRFRFKFQEGHSKNFKREVTFDWFLGTK